MVRERIVGGGGEDDEPFEATPEGSWDAEPVDPAQPTESDSILRPRRLAEVVGQREVVEVLEIAIDAARRRQEPLGHILLDGPPGLGKTTFATCVPRELGVAVQMASGPSLKAPKELLPYLTNLTHGSVLFIDEIHRLPKAVEEYLYTAMEDFRIDIVLGEGVNARTLNLQLKPFTLIGATTRAGMLSGPLRDRFQLRQHLGYYSQEDLVEILRRNAVKLSADLDNQAAQEIAGRSRGTPRVANNRLLWVRDYATSRADGRITLDVTRRALQMTGIDALGLDRQDRRYLTTLLRVFQGGPAGLEAIAHTMSVSSDTLEDEVEPYLLRSELIVRTARGRCLTARGMEHCQRESSR
ncbi:MAG: Holliday junction branch migration DNA helicase RuvB [Pirellulaceae bacterium]|jgi:Holliday junction DNA helicase RuvB